jgi:glycine/D-amino acid oxidase-like deaminating enzyme
MLRIDEVQDSAIFPESSDVVVIGGGIAGICTAYELARAGVSVTVLEKGVIAGEQSGRNWGFVRQQFRDYAELPIAMYALRRWGELAEEVQRDLGFRRTGVLFGATSEAELNGWAQWNEGAKPHGFASELLSASAMKARTPGATSAWVGGIFSPTDGCGEPGKAAPAIAEGAKQHGALIHQHCAVRGLDISAGRISGVWTERGLIKASTVVCAGGAWSSRLCQQYGINLPVANIVGTVMRTSAAPEVTPGGLVGPGFAIRRRLDGGYTLAVPGYGRMDLAPQGLRHSVKFYPLFRSKLNKKLKVRIGRSFFDGPEASGRWDPKGPSPFEKNRILDPAIDREFLQPALDTLVKNFPQLQGIRVVQSWAGAIDTTPDLLPIIDRSSKLPGLVIASGFSGHGFGLGPGSGKLISQIVRNETPYCDIAPFAVDRFARGNAIRKPAHM